jgi:putative membrane protein
MTVAVRGPLLVFLLPAGVLAPLARSSRVRATLATLLRPRVAFGLWAANLAIWHVPYLYDLALRHDSVHYFEHACWVVAGFLVWTLLVDPGSHKRLTVGGRIAVATAMFACGQVLADVLIFSFHPLYPAYPGRTDQQLAGIVMMAEQLVTLAALAFVLLRPRLRASRLVAA